MAKEKTVYVCTNCGQDSPKWVGKCPSCGAWNTYVEEVVRKKPANKRPVSGLEPVKSKPVTLNDITGGDEPRRAEPGIGRWLSTGLTRFTGW